MSTAAVSSSALNQTTLQQYFQTRHTDLKQLGQALASGNLAGAQTALNNIVKLGQNGPFPGGDPFKINQREQAFTAIGTALQAGDLAGAQKAFSELGSTFKSGGQQLDPPGTSPTATATPNAGAEAVLNLLNASPSPSTGGSSNTPSSGGGLSVSA